MMGRSLLLVAVVVVAFLTGSTVAVSRADSWLTAVATALLTLIAGIQLRHELRGDDAGKAAMRQKLLPHAWLAIRNCIAASEEAKTQGCRQWLGRNVKQLDLIETRLLTCVTLSADIGGPEAAAATKAFGVFVEAGKLVTDATDPARGYSTEQMTAARDAAGAKYAEVVSALAMITAALPVAPSARPALADNEP